MHIFAILLIGDSQQTRYVESMLFYCWASVADNGPTLKQHWLKVLCLFGHNINIITHDIFFFFSKQDTLTQCCLNVGSLSATLAQHSNNFWSTALVYWVLFSKVFEITHNVQSSLYIMLTLGVALWRGR